MDVGDRVRYWRERRAMTQAQLAAKVGINRATLSLIETGRTKPRADTVARVADALGVDTMQLFEGEHAPLAEALPSRAWLEANTAGHFYLSMSDDEAHEVISGLMLKEISEVKDDLDIEKALIEEELQNGESSPELRASLETARRDYVQWLKELDQARARLREQEGERDIGPWIKSIEGEPLWEPSPEPSPQSRRSREADRETTADK